MEKVTGIGGFFFRARDPDALAAWYKQHLGVETDLNVSPWIQQPGPTVFLPFKQDTSYLGRPEQTFMINFRVADLNTLVAQLWGAGIEVETRPEWDDPQIGRFARIHDPEGNPIELWEPLKA